MKRIFLLGLCLLMAAGLHAQDVYRSSGKPKYNSRKKKDQDPFVQRLIFGGGLTAGFGDYTTVGITPVIGYRITDNLSAGIGLGYQYMRVNNFFPITDSLGNLTYQDLKANLFSTSVWVRYIFWRNLFGQAEIERNFMSFNDYGFDQNGSGNVVERKTHYDATSLLLGIGYRQPIGERASVNFSINYDVLDDEYSPYGKQLFPRIQFLIGF